MNRLQNMLLTACVGMLMLCTLRASEFTIAKEQSVTRKKQGPPALKEEIIRHSGNLLKTKTELDKVNVELQELLLNQVEQGLDGGKKTFFGQATLVDLKKCLAELNHAEQVFEQRLIATQQQLVDLKNAFNVCSKK